MPENATIVLLALGLVLCLPAALSAQPPGGPPGGPPPLDHDIGNQSTAAGKDALANNTTGRNNTASGYRTLYPASIPTWRRE